MNLPASGRSLGLGGGAKRRSPAARAPGFTPGARRRRTAHPLLAPIAALALLAGGWTPPAAPLLLVVSIDGLHPAMLRDARATPHLSRLLSEGASARAVTGVWPTLTYPSHATMVTGVAPRHHGIVANQPFSAEGGERGWYWYAEDLRVPALWDVAEAAGRSVAAVDWPVTVGARIRFNVAQFWRDDDWHDPRLRRAVSTPGLLAEMERALGPYPRGHAGLDEDRRRAEFAAWLVARQRPALQLVYFSALDELLHAHGPAAAASQQVLAGLDTLVGRVWRAAGERPVQVALVSDHGFAAVDVAIDALEALERAGLAARPDRAARAHVRAAEGVAAFSLADPGDDAARARLWALARGLAADPALGVDRLLSSADLRRAGAFPGAELAIALRPGFRFEARGSGALSRAEGGGTHGFGPDHEEMDAVFAVAGPGIAAGLDLGRIDMRDVGPTLAGLMGLALPAAEGRDLSPLLRRER